MKLYKTKYVEEVTEVSFADVKSLIAQMKCKDKLEIIGFSINILLEKHQDQKFSKSTKKQVGKYLFDKLETLDKWVKAADFVREYKKK